MSRLTLVSDFNIDVLARLLRAADPTRVVEVAPYGQLFQALAGAAPDPSATSLVWGRAEAAMPTFARALALEPVEMDDCLAEVDTYADFIRRHAEGRRHVLVVAWSLPVGQRGYGMLDWQPGLGLANLLARMNLRLADRLAEAGNVRLLDGERWLRGVAKPALPKMWYAAKVPFANQVFEHAAADLVAALRAFSGGSRKLVVLDLDNTLWGGVVGETGWQGVRLGGHDHVGEAFKDFQAALKALANRGIQLAVVSKNDEAVALEAIDNHAEMVLRRDDFAGWRINWHDKAANIAALVGELNLGLGAVVFIDDNPAERDRVRNALPEVLVPDWPADPSAYVAALHSLDCFETAALSAEDRGRTAMYVAERQRRDHRQALASAEDWLVTLATTVTVEPVGPANLARVAQLFNKTNQVNMTTRRLSEKEIAAWAEAPNRSLLALSVSDRFGDMGLVGIVGVEAEGGEGRVVDFILSCRVMGRKVEDAMVGLAVAELTRLGAVSMEARYLATARNRPTLDVLRGAGLAEVEEHVFRHACAEPYPIPASVTVKGPPRQ